MNRRSFCNTAAAGIAGMTAGTAFLKSSPRAFGKSANEKLFLALVGAGGRGTTLASNFSAIPNVEFKYMCEVNDNRSGEVMRSLQKASGNAPQRLKEVSYEIRQAGGFQTPSFRSNRNHAKSLRSLEQSSTTIPTIPTTLAYTRSGAERAKPGFVMKRRRSKVIMHM